MAEARQRRPKSSTTAALAVNTDQATGAGGTCSTVRELDELAMERRPFAPGRGMRTRARQLCGSIRD
jgi:hypothetical protein